MTETVFQWPGMGLLLVQSIGAADIPVMSAYLLLVALLFVAINLIVDLLYYAVDPRLQGRSPGADGNPMNASLARAWDSDFSLHFRRSPVALVSALVLLVWWPAPCSAPGWRRTTRSTSPA